MMHWLAALQHAWKQGPRTQVSSNRDALPGPTTLTNVDLGLTGAWLRSLQKEKVAVTAPCPETGDEPDRVLSHTTALP